MPDYDFKSLSSYDFEIVVRDLLQAELGKTLESFKTGRDKGIDLRYCIDSANTLIVQCKHYAGSNYNALYSHLKLKEIAKVESLKPQRYVLATSLGLTPDNKTSLLKLFSPYCVSTSDIYGREDLNNLLGKFPQVEKNNFKLWLTSTSVLQRILQSAVFNQTSIDIENIKRKLKLYVGNESFKEARTVLEQVHYCIISGIPGIGKTTLAEMLIVDYLARGYEVIKVTSNIFEAYRAHRPNSKQVFYYDDFLGRIGLEDKLLKNEEQSLLKLIEDVHHSKESRLILTTREYILNQAKQTYESLATSNFDAHKCVISLSRYSEFQKAKILFNHVYFSNLSTDHKANLLQDKNYLKVINHKNYNPRIIEVMTGFASEPEEPGQSYIETFLHNLDNPTRIWDHAFSKHISEASRHLLTVLLTLPDEAEFDDLHAAFEAYYRYSAKWYGLRMSPRAFLDSLQELDGNFITLSAKGSQRFISAHNPSILDFLHKRVQSNAVTVQHLLASAAFFEQSIKLWGFAKGQASTRLKEIREIARHYPHEFLDSLKRTFKSARLKQRYILFDNAKPSPLEDRLIFTIQAAEELDTTEAYDTVRELLAELMANIQTNDSNRDSLLRLLNVLTPVTFDYGIERSVLLASVKDCFLRRMNQLDDFVRILEFGETFEGSVTEEDKSIVETQLRRFLDEYVETDANGLNRSGEVEEYADQLEYVANIFGFTVATEVDWLNTMANEMSVKEHDEEREDYFADLAKEEYGPVASTPSSGDTIASMFETLIPK